jgi:4-amino-4-deoxy-L-arabinose transferase-like glycosyltransferase
VNLSSVRARLPRAVWRSPWPGAVLAAALGLAAQLVFLAERHNPFLAPDTQGYFRIADGVPGSLFSSTSPRLPGYPLFVWVVQALPGGREVDVVALQHVLVALLAGAVFLVGWRWFDRATAVAASVLVALSPLLVATADDALPDVLVGVLLLAFAALVVQVALGGPPDGRWAWRAALGLGVLLGASILVKPVGQVLVLAVPITLAAAGWAWRAWLRTTALVAAVALVVVSPWVVHDWVRFGQPSLSDQAGQTLFNRLFEVDHRPVPTTLRAGRIARAEQLRITAQATPERLYVVTLERLEDQVGLSDVQASRLERRLAVEAIEADPLGYAGRTLELGRRYLREARTTRVVAEVLDFRGDPGLRGLDRWLWDLHDRLIPIWTVLTLSGWSILLGLGLGPWRRRVATAGLLSAGGLVALATVATHGGLPRYTAEVLPLTFLLTVAGASAGVRALWRGAASTRRG